LGDATDAQCLQTTTDHLAEVANQMAAAGLIKLERPYATAWPRSLSGEAGGRGVSAGSAVVMLSVGAVHAAAESKLMICAELLPCWDFRDCVKKGFAAEKSAAPVASHRHTRSFDCVRLTPHFAQDDSALKANACFGFRSSFKSAWA
jgi:hypothetical protein